MFRAHRVPPSPDVMARLFAEYLQHGKPNGLSFKQYLAVIGLTDAADTRKGMDDGARAVHARSLAPQRIAVPGHRVQGTLRVVVLLADFSDRVGAVSPEQFSSMLFSKGEYPTGSMRDFFAEVSAGKVDVVGSVHGWLRLPQTYAYYTNGQSGTGDSYPRNAQGMTADALRAAIAAGVPFPTSLDALGDGSVTALFVVHAGPGAEVQSDATQRNDNVWSHKWTLPTPLSLPSGLTASVYLTVPEDAKVGVCAHELGHLAFQWEDFYDPNYDEDGSEWDGSGAWDLMAGGSWNGHGSRPAHPAALHKLQHGWVELREVSSNSALTLDPFTADVASVVKLTSPRFRSGQYLLLENRSKKGFDSELPGEGLLVWRVDEAEEMFKPDRPALALLQADGRNDLSRPDDWNSGDAGDPFPGSSDRTELTDAGNPSTSFAQGAASGISLRNIRRDPSNGRVSLNVEFAAASQPDVPTATTTGRAEPRVPIPDNDPRGVSSSISLGAAGSLREVAVELAITHPYVGDLRVELFAPSGVSAVLHDRQGGGADDIRRVFRSSEVPALEALIGAPISGAWRLQVTDAARADAGMLESWGISVVSDAGSDEIRALRSPRLAIPDNNAAGIADATSVTEAGVARSISVRVDITHSYVGDLRLELVAPDGTTALLQNRQDGNARDLKKTYTSADTAALSALIGRELRGSWSLRVSDLAGQDLGTLNSWELLLKRSTAPATAQQEVAAELAIPDADPAGVGSALSFGAEGTVQALTLKALIEHPYIGDLQVELVTPAGTRAVLWNRAGGRTQNLSLELNSATSRELAALTGQPLTGVWTLRVADLAGQDAGKLKYWSLGATYG